MILGQDADNQNNERELLGIVEGLLTIIWDMFW